MPSFAREIPKELKPRLGRSSGAETPVDIHSKFHIDEGFREQVRAHLGRAMGAYAPRIERVFVHFEDVNGVRGGEDTLCRIKVAMSGEEPIVVEELALDAEVALNRAIPRITRCVQRAIERHARPSSRR
jgi:hypothetical protein